MAGDDGVAGDQQRVFAVDQGRVHVSGEHADRVLSAIGGGRVERFQLAGRTVAADDGAELQVLTGSNRGQVA